jgi:hypothetical protein
MRIGTRTPIGSVDGFAVLTPGDPVGWVEDEFGPRLLVGMEGS